MPNKNLVTELEEINYKIKIVEVSALKGNLHILDKYVAKHKNVGTSKNLDPYAAHSFNDYLQYYFTTTYKERVKALNEEAKVYKKEYDAALSASKSADNTKDINKFKQAAESAKASREKALESAKKEYAFYKENYAEKIIVAEISGEIGMPSTDIYGSNSESGYETENIVLDGADLSGSRLVDCRIHTSLENVILRDCFFEKVAFDRADLSSIDMRGTKLKNCSFIGYDTSDDTRLQELHLDFHNVNNIDLELFDIPSYNRTDEVIKELDILSNAYNTEVEEFKKNKYANQGYISWLMSPLYTTAEQERFLSEIKEGLEKIKQEYETQKVKLLKDIKQLNRIIPNKIKYDPTYIPKNKELAESVKIKLHATQQDLLKYQDINKNYRNKKSFNDFIADLPKNKELLYSAARENDSKSIIAVAYLNKEAIENLDLSGLDLSGVNFAETDFKGCNFKGADLTGSCLESTTFSDETSFEDAILTDVNLVGASGRKINFSNVFAPRVRMMYSQFPESNFKKGLLYSADLTGSNVESSSLSHASAKLADLEKVNMRYVDARYAEMQYAKLSSAILNDANFSMAQLNNAVMDNVIARNANFTKAALENANLQYTNLRKAILENVKANGINLTKADLRGAKVQMADLTRAIMNDVNAQFADFKNATLQYAQAQQADFSHAVMEKIKGERLDIKRALLKETNLRKANLSKAIMQEVESYKANFYNANLADVQARYSNLISCDLQKSNAKNIDIRNAILYNLNAESADLSDAKFNKDTILSGANFREAKGAEGLKAQKEEQEKLKLRLFERSKYGYCANNADGSNDRFKCQRVGAAILSTVIGSGTGYAFSGILGGATAGIVSGLLNDKALVASKNLFFQEQGYISNTLGDKLAELGAIAIASGIDCLDAAVNRLPLATSICITSGVVSAPSGVNIGLTGAGLSMGYLGAGKITEGYQQQSMLKSFWGSVLLGSASVATFFGLGQVSLGFTLFAGTLVCGSEAGLQGATFAHTQLLKYNEETESGMRPEQIYVVAVEKGNGVLEKMLPTLNKFKCSLIYGAAGFAVGIALAFTVTHFLGLGLMTIPIVSTVASALGVIGLKSGYIFDKKLSFWKLPEEKIPTGKEAAHETKVVTNAEKEGSSTKKTVDNVFQKNIMPVSTKSFREKTTKSDKLAPVSDRKVHTRSKSDPSSNKLLKPH
jgi:uncharacterized protein YjbI with pentapeptide repeats